MGHAVHRGNHRLLKCLLEGGASLDKVKPGVPLTLMMRTTSLLEIPKEGTGLAAEFKWKRKLHRATRNTACTIQVLLPYLPETRNIKNLQGDAGLVLILDFVRRWREPDTYVSSANQAVKEVLGAQASAELVGTSVMIVDGDAGQFRRPTRDEGLKCECLTTRRRLALKADISIVNDYVWGKMVLGLASLQS
ncbi:hypothetical protein GQ53DRAFT_134290 [Thozetella sp. PMI_491]|nr:hypothetical protein GQ53DRAFT_134290 [Thozetella sp. PMI_491]